MRGARAIVSVMLACAVVAAEAAASPIVFSDHVARAPQNSCSSFQTFTVYGKTSGLPNVERAAEIESAYVSRFYGTPCARFGTGGWPVYLTDESYMQQQCGPGSSACHGVNPQPYAVIGPGLSAHRSLYIIHEILEMLADPMVDHTDTREICDQYSPQFFSINGVQAPAFALPDGSEMNQLR